MPCWYQLPIHHIVKLQDGLWSMQKYLLKNIHSSWYAKLQTVSWRIQPNLDEATKESEPYIMHLADRGGFPGKAEYELGKKPINRSNIQARSGAVPVVILPDGTYLKDT